MIGLAAHERAHQLHIIPAEAFDCVCPTIMRKDRFLWISQEGMLVRGVESLPQKHLFGAYRGPCLVLAGLVKHNSIWILVHVDLFVKWRNRLGRGQPLQISDMVNTPFPLQRLGLLSCHSDLKVVLIPLQLPF